MWINERDTGRREMVIDMLWLLVGRKECVGGVCVNEDEEEEEYRRACDARVSFERGRTKPRSR